MSSYLKSEFNKIILNNFRNTNLGSIVFSLLTEEQTENFIAEIHGYKNYEDIKSVFQKTFHKKKKFPFLYSNSKYLYLKDLRQTLQENLNIIYKKYVLLIIENLKSDGFIDIDDLESLTEQEIYDLLSFNYNDFEKNLSVPNLSVVDSLNFISYKNTYLKNTEQELLAMANEASFEPFNDIKELLKRNVYAIFNDQKSFETLLDNSILINDYSDIRTENDLEHFFQKQKEFIQKYFQETTFFSQHFKEAIFAKQKLFQEVNMQHNRLKVYVLDFRSIPTSQNQLQRILENVPWHLCSQGRALGTAYFFIFNTEQKEEIMVPGLYQKLKAHILP